MKQFALPFSLLCSVALGQAQTFEAAAASAKSDLDKALAELSALEKKIADCLSKHDIGSTCQI